MKIQLALSGSPWNAYLLQIPVEQPDGVRRHEQQRRYRQRLTDARCLALVQPFGFAGISEGGKLRDQLDRQVAVGRLAILCFLPRQVQAAILDVQVGPVKPSKLTTSQSGCQCRRVEQLAPGRCHRKEFGDFVRCQSPPLCLRSFIDLREAIQRVVAQIAVSDAPVAERRQALGSGRQAAPAEPLLGQLL